MRFVQRYLASKWGGGAELNPGLHGSILQTLMNMVVSSGFVGERRWHVADSCSCPTQPSQRIQVGPRQRVMSQEALALVVKRGLGVFSLEEANDGPAC